MRYALRGFAVAALLAWAMPAEAQRFERTSGTLTANSTCIRSVPMAWKAALMRVLTLLIGIPNKTPCNP